MSISSVTSNTAGTSYSKAATTNGTNEQAASAGQAAVAGSPSTIVTLSNGQQTHVVEASSNSLKATPLALARAPHMLVAADGNKDQHLNLAEFTEQLKRVGTAAEGAKKLFSSFARASRNLIFVAILRCSRRISPYISNICGVEIFHSRLVLLRN